MSQEKNYDAENQRVIDRWSRERERAKDMAEHMTSEIKKILKKGIAERKRGVALDLKKATENPKNYDRGEGGFGVYDDGEIITGFEKYCKDD